MTRPASAPARWLAYAGAMVLVVAASGCRPPAHAAVTRCSNAHEAFPSGVRGECRITVATFDGSASAHIKVDTAKRLAAVRGRFTVQQGTVKIVLRGSAGSRMEVVVTPDTPAILEGTLRLASNRGGLRLRFEPDGPAAGLEGTLGYESR